MISKKYSHLKLQKMEKEYKYVLFETTDLFNKAISVLISSNLDFFCFSFKGEKSLICHAEEVIPSSAKEQNDWIGFKIVGEMPFGTVQGLISTISSCLFEEEIGVCVVSTFQTDLFLIKKQQAKRAIELLNKDGWEISS
jgi:hypothetical protein